MRREDLNKEKYQVIIKKQNIYQNLKKSINEIDIQTHQTHLDINKFTNKLIYHYHTILSQGKDTRKEGLVWIIKAIWNLGTDVILSFMPTFLDEKCIKFIFKVIFI